MDLANPSMWIAVPVGMKARCSQQRGGTPETEYMPRQRLLPHPHQYRQHKRAPHHGHLKGCRRQYSFPRPCPFRHRPVDSPIVKARRAAPRQHLLPALRRATQEQARWIVASLVLVAPVSVCRSRASQFSEHGRQLASSRGCDLDWQLRQRQPEKALRCYRCPMSLMEFHSIALRRLSPRSSDDCSRLLSGFSLARCCAEFV